MNENRYPAYFKHVKNFKLSNNASNHNDYLEKFLQKTMLVVKPL